MLIASFCQVQRKILHFLIFPEIYIQELNSRQPPNVTTHWGGLGNVWDELFKEDIRSSNHMIDIVIMDLKNWGLVHVSSFGQASLSYSSGTQFGKEFMKFIDKET